MTRPRTCAPRFATPRSTTWTTRRRTSSRSRSSSRSQAPRSPNRCTGWSPTRSGRAMRLRALGTRFPSRSRPSYERELAAGLALLPAGLARDAPGGVGNRLESILTDRPAAVLADPARASIVHLRRPPRLPFRRCLDLLDRVVGDAGADALSLIGVPESPAHLKSLGRHGRRQHVGRAPHARLGLGQRVLALDADRPVEAMLRES